MPMLSYFNKGENEYPPENSSGIHDYKILWKDLSAPKILSTKKQKLVGDSIKFRIDGCNKKLGKRNKYRKDYEAGVLIYA